LKKRPLGGCGKAPESKLLLFDAASLTEFQPPFSEPSVFARTRTKRNEQFARTVPVAELMKRLWLDLLDAHEG
jgi:hypothetical protein